MEEYLGVICPALKGAVKKALSECQITYSDVLEAMKQMQCVKEPEKVI